MYKRVGGRLKADTFSVTCKTLACHTTSHTGVAAILVRDSRVNKGAPNTNSALEHANMVEKQNHTLINAIIYTFTGAYDAMLSIIQSLESEALSIRDLLTVLRNPAQRKTIHFSLLILRDVSMSSFLTGWQTTEKNACMWLCGGMHSQKR